MKDLEEKDREAWEEFVQNIPSLEKKERLVYKPVKEIKINKDVTYFQIDSKNQEDLRLGSVDNIDASMAKKFQQNKFEVEGKLDLHGYNEERAYGAVSSFIKNAFLSGKRCVIIVTGKGLYQEKQDFFSSRGVLREKVPEWLNTKDLRPFILSFNHPEERLGGVGALYVLLKRKR